MLVRRGDILKGRWAPAPLCPVTKASAAFAQFSSGFLDHGAGLLNILNILVQRGVKDRTGRQSGEGLPCLSHELTRLPFCFKRVYSQRLLRVFAKSRAMSLSHRWIGQG